MEPNASVNDVGAMMWKKHKLIFPRLIQKIIWDLMLAAFILYSVSALALLRGPGLPWRMLLCGCVQSAPLFSSRNRHFSRVALFVQVASVPYRIGFSVDADGAWIGIDILCDLFFFADIAITFRTTVTNEDGAYLLNAKDIAFNYLKGWFFIDFFSTVPFDSLGALFAPKGDNKALRGLKILRALRLAKLLKLLRLFKLKRLLGSHAKKVAIPPVLADFFKNFVLLVFFAHLMSCLWYAAGLRSCAVVERKGVTFITQNEHKNVTTYWRLHPVAVSALPSNFVPAKDAKNLLFSGSALEYTSHHPCSPPCHEPPVKFAVALEVYNMKKSRFEVAAYDDVRGSFIPKPEYAAIPESEVSLEQTKGLNSTELVQVRQRILSIATVGESYTWSAWNTTEGDSWLVWTGTHDLPDYADRYVAAMYWCFATFLAVGYGDIYATSTNEFEITVAVLGMSLGTIVFAMFISAVVNLIDETVEANGT